MRTGSDGERRGCVVAGAFAVCQSALMDPIAQLVEPSAR
jgi:hypothetical protein